MMIGRCVKMIANGTRRCPLSARFAGYCETHAERPLRVYTRLRRWRRDDLSFAMEIARTAIAAGLLAVFLYRLVMR